MKSCKSVAVLLEIEPGVALPLETNESVAVSLQSEAGLAWPSLPMKITGVLQRCSKTNTARPSPAYENPSPAMKTKERVAVLLENKPGLT